MGFRNPLTSAVAVDTGQPATAGARIYQGSDAQGVYGVLEYRDGIVGDNPSTITGRANLTVLGDGSYTAQGGSLVVKTGSFNGVTGPELDFTVEGLPAGGYGPVARLNVPLRATVAGAPTAPVFLNSWASFGSGYEPLTYTLHPDGDVYVSGLIKHVGALVAGASSPIFVLPPALWPTYRQILRCRLSGQPARVDVGIDGQVIFLGNGAYPDSADLLIRDSFHGPAFTY